MLVDIVKLGVEKSSLFFQLKSFWIDQLLIDFYALIILGYSVAEGRCGPWDREIVAVLREIYFNDLVFEGVI